MAYCLSDPAPHRGDDSHSASTGNAHSAIVARQIPRASIGGAEKLSVGRGQNHPKCLFRRGIPAGVAGHAMKRPYSGQQAPLLSAVRTV
jgi:hypothetical protein